ncbi:MAG TPA: AAA family ATPase [Acidimicrobiales bacterium]|nr:AAA family ATPase [Acidimicrobiales bacterium]
MSRDDGHTEPWAGVAETHSAVVFFAGDRAYKLKKPVRLEFLDFSTRADRERVCHREVELNRRIARDVYLDVADVVDGSGVLCDHLVVMRRMPASQRLATLVEVGAEVGDALRRVAGLLAGLHARSVRSAAADVAAGVAALQGRWTENHQTLERFTPEVFPDGAAAAVHSLACRYLAGRGKLFESRITRGRAVDGHGDLLADDIFCLEDGPRILDCIEFDDRHRLGDGLADAAFLAMDLERLGRADLGAAFLAEYAEALGDTWPPSLAHHHIAYRAQVRARVDSIRAEQGDAASGPRAVRLLQLARDHLERSRVRLVLVGGAPGTGKSTLAAHLAASLDAVVLRSDEVRKELAGVPSLAAAPAPFGAGIYAGRSTDATYSKMLDRASLALGMGETVILDATWLDDRWRRAARVVAATTHADLAELELVVPIEVLAARIGSRGGDPSDATPEIARRMLATASPWPEAHRLDASGAERDTLALAVRALRDG